jgi:asparagine synthase (glutamine-hydrolysing)
MCGIVGFNWPDEEKIRQMTNVISHRGPDDSGIYIDDTVTLGHRRLSILDLSPRGHQPMKDLERNYFIVYNGEIYNYKEIREELKLKGYKFRSTSDTEVLLKSYIEWGMNCVKKFNGMWAFAIYDKKKNLIFLSRDRFGIKPLYYYFKNDKFIFGSEIKSLFLHDITKSPNDLAIYDYLMYNIVDHENFTFFKEIYKIPKATYAVFDISKKTLDIIKYWKLEINKKTISFNKAKNKVDELFSNSVKLRLRSDVPVGSCLSGGIDSSSIVCKMTKLIDDKKKINTFTAAYPGFERDEERYVNILSESLKIESSKIYPKHTDLLKDLKKFLYHQEEPVRSTSQYSQYSVMKLASKNRYKVLVDGQGADEMLAGYHYFYGYYLYELFSKFHWMKLIKIIRKCKKNINNKDWLNYFYFMLLPSISQKRYFWKRSKNIISKDFANEFKNKSNFFKKAIKAKNLKDALRIHVEYKLEELLKWEDRNSMAFSIETRVPFLDYRLVEFIFNLIPDQIINDCYTKYIFRI